MSQAGHRLGSLSADLSGIAPLLGLDCDDFRGRATGKPSGPINSPAAENRSRSCDRQQAAPRFSCRPDPENDRAVTIRHVDTCHLPRDRNHDPLETSGRCLLHHLNLHQ